MRRGRSSAASTSETSRASRSPRAKEASPAGVSRSSVRYTDRRSAVRPRKAASWPTSRSRYRDRARLSASARTSTAATDSVSTGGIVDAGKFDFGASGRFPNLTEPDPSYHGLPYWPALGPGAYIIKARVQMLRDLGMAVSPFNAFAFLQGLETLSLRMERHWSNADRVAKFLANHAQVEGVSYAGLSSSPWHDRANRYFGGKGYGSVLAFVDADDFRVGFDVPQQVRGTGDVLGRHPHGAVRDDLAVADLDAPTRDCYCRRERVRGGARHGIVDTASR